MRVCVLGNSGSGKSTYAAQRARDGAAVLELDTIYWAPREIAVARPAAQVRAELAAFVAAHPRWVIEGCYAELIDAALPACTELVFLNPGVDACLANARRRPYEPHKYERPEDQARMLAPLLAWIEAYPTRDTDTGYAAHRRVFDAFGGAKRELTTLPPLD